MAGLMTWARGREKCTSWKRSESLLHLVFSASADLFEWREDGRERRDVHKRITFLLTETIAAALKVQPRRVEVSQLSWGSHWVTSQSSKRMWTPEAPEGHLLAMALVHFRLSHGPGDGFSGSRLAEL